MLSSEGFDHLVSQLELTDPQTIEALSPLVNSLWDIGRMLEQIEKQPGQEMQANWLSITATGA